MFACLVSGLSVNTNCVQVEPEKFLFDSVPIKSPSQHVAIFTTTPAASFWPSGYCAAIYLRFHEDLAGEWRYLGGIGEGKGSAFFRVIVPDGISSRFDVITASIGISIIPTASINALVPVTVGSASQQPALKDSILIVTRRLLDNFINYALSYSRTFDTGTESFIPAKTITDWYNNTSKKIQNDSAGFLNNLLRKDE